MARRETFEFHQHVGSGRVGLAVADMQTLHRGHVNLLNEMRMTCDTAIIGLGSVKQQGIEGHPFSFDQRKAMIQGVFGDAFRFVPLDDIDARTDRRDWYAYVEKKLKGAGLPEPTDYFGGSLIDASWYGHAFADDKAPKEKRVLTTTYTNPETGKRLHIVDREAAEIPSGREIRQLIEFRDPSWKLYVAERLHRFVEMEYPPHLRQPIDFADVVAAAENDATVYQLVEQIGFDRSLATFLTVKTGGLALPGEPRSSAFDRVMVCLEERFPVGTRLSDASHDEVLELKDDGKWRPLPEEDEKTRWARENRKGRKGR